MTFFNNTSIMAEKDSWITVPTVDDSGNTIIVTGCTDVAKFRSRAKYSIRVEVSMPYQSGGELGFPDDETAKLLGDITDAFEALLKGKNTAILTGIYTGAGRRCRSRYMPRTTPNGSNMMKCARPQLCNQARKWHRNLLPRREHATSRP